MRHVVMWGCVMAAAGAGAAAAVADEPTPTEKKLIDQAKQINGEGVKFYREGCYAEALEKMRKAFALRRLLYPASKYPGGHPHLAISLSNLASVYEAMGAYGRAVLLYEQALAMRRRLYPADKYPDGHPDLAVSLNILASVHRTMEAYGQAESLYKQSLAMYRRLFSADKFPNGHPRIANILNDLALTRYETRAYGEAARIYEQALVMNRRLYPADKCPDGHPDLATNLNNLAHAHEATGAYGRAVPLYEQALAMRRRLYPADKYPDGHPDLAVSLNNLAHAHEATGAYGRAVPLYEQALAMSQKLYPPSKYPAGHPHLAISLNNLASVHQSIGVRSDEVLFLYDMALAANRKLYPTDKFPAGHPDLAASLNNLANAYQAIGGYGSALPLYEQALAMRRRLYPSDKYPYGHPGLAHSLENLAGIHLETGKYGLAEQLYEQALAMHRRLYPADKYPDGHPDLVRNLENLAYTHQATSSYSKAVLLFEEASAMTRRLCDLHAAIAAEAEVYDQLNTQALTLDALLSLPAETVKATVAYVAIWLKKGFVGRLVALRRRELAAAAVADPNTRSRLDELFAARAALARALLAPAGGPAAGDQIAALNDAKERLERDLARVLPVRTDDQLTPAAFTDRLPIRTAFVDLLRYTRFAQDPQRPGAAGETRTPSYVAFVVSRSRPVARVDLGPAAPIDAAAEAWRAAVLGRPADDRPAAEVRRLVWDRVADALPDDTTGVYLSPDAALCRVPWAALPGRRPNTVLLDEVALAVVPNGPWLAEWLDPATKRPAGGSLVAVGGVAYDRAPSGKPLEVVQRSAAGVRGGWGDLPGTAAELGRVLALAGGRAAVKLDKADASTARLVAELPKARWAHLATHGFFADKSFRSIFQVDETHFAGMGERGRVAPGARNPLVLSGLVFAGANRDGQDADADRGVLTAEVIAGLHLDGMELAVLSACETGLGEVAGGEGVFGLQRAFHIAGCRNVVASLWKVDDEATAALMTVFYRELWQNKRTPLEALRAAQLTVYRHPELIPELAGSRGIDFDKRVKVPPPGAKAEPPPAGGKTAPVRQWAAFVLSGPGD